MTRQQEIREEIWQILRNSGLHIAEADSTLETIWTTLHSRGVVLKVERELPKNPIKVTTYLGLTKAEAMARQMEHDCFVRVIQDQMLKAGCGFFESLIKEESNG